MNLFHSDQNCIKTYRVFVWMTEILLLCFSSTSSEELKFGAVTCSYAGITVEIFPGENFEGIIYTQGNFFNPSCRYYTPLDSAAQNISFSISLTDCGTLIRESRGTLYISNKIIVQKYSFVETAFDVVRNVSCELNFHESLEPEERGSHGNHSNRFKNDLMESWMDFQSGVNVLGLDVSNKMMVGDKFLMVIHLKDGGVHKAMKVEKCWAYDGETVEESEYALQIYDRHSCEQSEWISEFNFTKGKKVSDNIAYAVVNAFKFPTTRNVHITCSILVCSNACLDYCKVPESLRSNVYPWRSKRSIPDDTHKSLRERYKLMRATVKALGAKLIETNKAQRSKSNATLYRRISNSRRTDADNFSDVTAAEGNEYDKVSSFSDFHPTSSNPLSSDIEPETDYFRNDMLVFNVTNNVVVYTDHDINFKHEKDALTNFKPNCVSRVRFGMVMASLSFISISLFIALIGLALYLRKERKKNKMNNFLLYNLY